MTIENRYEMLKNRMIHILKLSREMSTRIKEQEDIRELYKYSLEMADKIYKEANIRWLDQDDKE